MSDNNNTSRPANQKWSFFQGVADAITGDYKTLALRVDRLTRENQELKETLARYEGADAIKQGELSAISKGKEEVGARLQEWLDWACQFLAIRDKSALLADGDPTPHMVSEAIGEIEDELLQAYEELHAAGEIPEEYEAVHAQCRNVADALKRLDSILIDEARERLAPAMPEPPKIILEEEEPTKAAPSLAEILANPSSQDSVLLAQYRDQAVRAALASYGLPANLDEIKQMARQLEDLRREAEWLRPDYDLNAKESNPDAYKSYVALLLDLMDDVEQAVNAIYTGPDRSLPVPSVVDKKIINNDYYGFYDFITDLRSAIDKTWPKTAERAAEAARDIFAECLRVPSATWLDNLVRLHAYACVPFIYEQFAASGVNVDKIESAYAVLEALLARLGITLIFPRLFADEFDPEEYDAEPIKNITSVAEDIADHVKNEEQIIDIFCAGYAIDGRRVSKPIVSRINN